MEKESNILWHVNTLLGNDPQVSDCQRPVLGYANGHEFNVFYNVRVQMLQVGEVYKQLGIRQLSTRTIPESVRLHK
jgi:hypothetical protein